MIYIAFERINPTPILPANLQGKSFAGRKWDSKARIVKAFKEFLKPELRALQVGHCCFCRRHLFDDNTVDIEHFLEKAVVPATCFEIQNLALSCKTCNLNKEARLKAINKRINRHTASPKVKNICPGLHGLYDQGATLALQKYRWVHPHFHDYSTHIKINCGWIYQSMSGLGARTIKGLKLNQIAKMEERALSEKTLARGAHLAQLVKSLQRIDSDYEQKVSELLFLLKDQAIN